MRHQCVLWRHSFPTEPVVLYSECDDEGWEVRKVEVFADGTMTFADAQESTGSTGLGEVPIPPLAEIAKDPQFEPAAITKEEFEAVWRQARQFRPRPMKKAQ